MTRPDPTDLARRMLAAAKEVADDYPDTWSVEDCCCCVTDIEDVLVSKVPYCHAHHIALCSPANIKVLAEAYLDAKAQADALDVSGYISDVAVATAKIAGTHVTELQSRIDRALELFTSCDTGLCYRLKEARCYQCRLYEALTGMIPPLYEGDEPIRAALTGTDET